MVFVYTIGAFLTLDAYTIILVQDLTSSLDTVTWSTQLTKSNMVPKEVTQKIDIAYIYYRHAQDQYRSFSFQNLAPDLLINDYYHFITGQMIKFYYRWQ